MRTRRALGAPSRLAVASDIASGSAASLALASANQRSNCTKGASAGQSVMGEDDSAARLAIQTCSESVETLTPVGCFFTPTCLNARGPPVAGPPPPVNNTNDERSLYRVGRDESGLGGRAEARLPPARQEAPS